MDKFIKFIPGNEACALGALDAGARFFAGYPISPASEIAEYCSRELPKRGGTFIQMEDEIGSIAAVVGASLGGALAFTATSGPGFSLMQENLGLAMIAEVPCVVIDVQRYGPGTGVATRTSQGDLMQARWGTHGDHGVIALSPTSVQESYDLTIEAFRLAERFSTPVFILTDASLAHIREKVRVANAGEQAIVKRRLPEVPPEDYLPYAVDNRGVPTLAPYGGKHILRVTGLVHDETGYSSNRPEVCSDLITRLEHKISGFQKELPSPHYFGPEDADIVLISYGIASRAAREAARRLSDCGRTVGTIQLRTVWPLPEAAILKFCSHATTAVVVEMNAGQLVMEIERIIKGKCEVIHVLRYDTQVITPTEIVKRIQEVC